MMKLLFLVISLALASVELVEESDFETTSLDCEPPSHSYNFKFNDTEKGNRGSRIFSGESAEDGQFPWVARLAIRTSATNYISCTGSLISNLFLLSAGHCVCE